MRLLRAWTAAGLACMALAGCSYPDLRVTAAYQGYTCYDDGNMLLNLYPHIHNEGTADVVLSKDWTKPWLTAYPSVTLPGFVRPYQTCWAGLPCPLTLKPGESEIIGPLGVLLPREPEGKAYQLIVEVDPNKAYNETNEGNNTSNIDIPAKVCG